MKNISLESRAAKLYVNYSLNVQRGELVYIWCFGETAIPQAKEVYREIIKAGGHPYMNVVFDGQEYIYYKESQEHQVLYQNPIDLFTVQNINVAIRIHGISNTRELSNISAEKIQKVQMAQIEFWKTFFTRQGKQEIKWISVPYPTDSLAQEANMSREEYVELFEKSCFLNTPDPVAEWKKISKYQQKYCDYLDHVEKLHIVGKGTDVTMSVKGRKWENCDGHKNLPDGEIFTGPIENEVDGIITFSFPGIYRSKLVENIVLQFKNGKVVEATAKKGQDLLDQILKIPGASRIGEIGIGMNCDIQQFVNMMIFDEKIAGTIHVALGNGYPQTGSNNRSAIHWDILCDLREDGKIYGDGKLIYEKGRFLI